MATGITLGSVLALGQELGWRGFLFGKLEGKGLLKVSLITGIVWGVWQLPVISNTNNYPHHPAAGIFMSLAWYLLLSPILCYIRIKSRSVIPVAMFMGTFNAVYPMSIVLLKGGSDITVGATGLAGLFVLALFDAAIFLYESAPDDEPELPLPVAGN
jgi:membrane protease YdiL (CAAX protease family)